jgi:CRP-like cAMP-binding protein
MPIAAPPKVSPASLTSLLFSRRHVLTPRTDVLYRIERGTVRTLTWDESGRCIALGYWGIGDIVGHALSRINPYQIECLSSVEVSILPPELWHQAFDALLSHIQQSEELLSIVHLHPVSLRLWQFLVCLGQKFGRDVDQGRLIDLQVTQQELAEAISATRVTVTRLLRQYESEGSLLRHSRRFILKNCQH